MLFLEGENSVQGRKKSLEIWKALLAALTFSFQQAETGHSQGNSQAPSHRTFSFHSQRQLSHLLCGTSLWLLALVCFQPGAATGPWWRSPRAVEKTVHIWLFSRLRDREGGVGMTTRSLGKIFTKVVFELTTKGRAGCQVCACFGGKPVCARGFREQ